MSIFEWPEPMLKAVVVEGLVSGWKAALELPTAEARAKAKQEILRDYMETYENDQALATAARLYIEVGPILAEHRAISKAAKKMPQIRNVAPEVLTPDEAVELMKHETLAPPEEWELVLKHDLRRRREMCYASTGIRPAWAEPYPISDF